MLCSCVLLLQSSLLFSLHVPFPWLQSLAESPCLWTPWWNPCWNPILWHSLFFPSPKKVAKYLPCFSSSFGIIPHPQSSIPCSGSVTALSTSLEEVSKSGETATCWGAPAALSLVEGGDAAGGSQGTWRCCSNGAGGHPGGGAYFV